MENNNDIVITLPNDADYTDIITELVYWFENGDHIQVEILTEHLRKLTDSLAQGMPKTIESN